MTAWPCFSVDHFAFSLSGSDWKEPEDRTYRVSLSMTEQCPSSAEAGCGTDMRAIGEC